MMFVLHLLPFYNTVTIWHEQYIHNFCIYVSQNTHKHHTMDMYVRTHVHSHTMHFFPA